MFKGAISFEEINDLSKHIDQIKESLGIVSLGSDLIFGLSANLMQNYCSTTPGVSSSIR